MQTASPEVTQPAPAAPVKPAAVARVHEAKQIPSETLWTAHSVGGFVFLLAIAFIVFARGPTRAQALAAAAKSSKNA